MSHNLKPKLFSLSNSETLATAIASQYGANLGSIDFRKFTDGEFRPAFNETVRGRRVFIIGSTFSPSDNLMEMLLLCDAAKRASAGHITAVIPYFGWARQDRKDKPRVPITAKLVAKQLETAGSKRAYVYSKHLNSEVVICYKQRNAINQIEEMELIGDAKNGISITSLTQ